VASRLETLLDFVALRQAKRRVRVSKHRNVQRNANLCLEGETAFVYKEKHVGLQKRQLQMQSLGQLTPAKFKRKLSPAEIPNAGIS